MHDKYGDLLNDDPIANKRYCVLVPIADIIGESVLINCYDVYIMKYEWAKVGFKSWGKNLQTPWIGSNGWTWDGDRFGNNFLAHPFTGAGDFNSARACGYNFWESAPFALLGSYTWKLFGENDKPERNSVIVTTLGGIYMGEVLYRISSNILDDRTTGAERVGREALAFLIDPARGFNRLFQGKTWRSTSTEVYQKEPLTVGFSGGMRAINNGVTFASGPRNPIFNFQLDYGDPFEDKARNPFDLFKVRLECNFGVGRKFVDNVIGYGILTGTNRTYGNLEALWGFFFGYDYWDNKEFELYTSSITAGIMTRWNLSKISNLYTKFHIGIAPFASNSTVQNPDTSQFRDYDFAYGGQAQFESTLNLGRYLSFTIADYVYFLHTFNAPSSHATEELGTTQVSANGNNLTDIFRPKITISITHNMKIAFEQVIYYSTDSSPDFPTIHRKQSEQKVFLTYNIQDFHLHKHDNDK